MKSVVAIAHSNIALVKYWGKRPDTDPRLNLPAVGSLSLTLDRLWTQTRIEPHATDVFSLDGEAQSAAAAKRVWAHLDRVWASRNPQQPRPPCAVHSTNHFPTAAGLASSASGFAALTKAADAAFGLDTSDRELSIFARMGSGSAARSIFGGFVRLHRGRRDDGEDCYAEPLPMNRPWPLALVVVQTTRGAKGVGSTEGMERSRLTAPYYDAWVNTSDADLQRAEAAIERRDLGALGEIVEHSCFKMHACMMASRPPILYWKGPTLSVIHRVWALRSEGTPGYVTMDAGPHVKVLCTLEDAAAVANACADVPGVESVEICQAGPGATVEAAQEGAR